MAPFPRCSVHFVIFHWMRIISNLRGDRVGFQSLQVTLPKLGIQDGVERIIFKLGAAKSTSTSLAVPRSSAQFHLGVQILLSVESFGKPRIPTPSLVVLRQPTIIHGAAILSTFSQFRAYERHM